MTHYAGLDFSMNTTFICIVNEKGKVVKELEAVSTPESIDSFCGNDYQFELPSESVYI
jgi:hypothetical protein